MDLHKCVFHATATNDESPYSHSYHTASVDLETWELAAFQHGKGDVVWKRRQFNCEVCGCKFEVDGGTFTWE